MASHRWGGIAIVSAMTSVVFVACSTSSSSLLGASGTSSDGGGVGSPAATNAVATGMSPGARPPKGPLACAGHTYSSIAVGPCDLLQQDCPAGSTCRELLPKAGIWTTHCVVANGLKGEGETCALDEECLATLTCGAGRCVPVCCSLDNAPCIGGTCDLRLQLDSATNDFKQVCHYAKACTLLVAGGCEPGFDCHIEDAIQGLATCMQRDGAPVPDLAPCRYLNDCGDMEDCFASPAGASACHFYCRIDQPNPSASGPGLGGCPPGQTCQAVLEGTLVDFRVPHVGLCAPSEVGSSASTGTP